MPGHARRTPKVTPNTRAHPIATASTGVSVLPAQPGRAADAVGKPSDDRHEERDRQQHPRGAHELLDDAAARAPRP